MERIIIDAGKIFVINPANIIIAIKGKDEITLCTTSGEMVIKNIKNIDDIYNSILEGLEEQNPIEFE